MFKTITEIKEANKRAGCYFFDEKAMKAFHSKMCTGVFSDHFITSEQFDAERKYTIRHALENGAIETVSVCGEFRTLREARAVMTTMVRRSRT